MISPSQENAMVDPESVQMDPNSYIQVRYVPHSHLANFLNTNSLKVLGLVEYGPSLPVFLDPNLIGISVNMEQLNEPSLCEVWTSPLPIASQKVHGVQVAFNDEVVFGHVQCEGLEGLALEEVVHTAYSQIFDTVSVLKYPYLYRIWNYFPEINSELKGLEGYKRFCIGRHRAFSERFKKYKLILPAASAVGTLSGPFQLYFVAGRRKAMYIENPRQISAYDYPPLYGPKSPSFARATCIPMPSWSNLYIAGTASIVGHATRHKDDCLKQTREIITNLESLLEHAKKTNPGVIPSNHSLSLLKVYLRHRQHFEVVREVIREKFGHQIPTLYLCGEMCRKDLFVEMEAL